jgi:hypothetical protein
MATGIRIVFKPSVELGPIQTYAWRRNWNITGATREDESPTRFSWETIDGEAEIVYLEDPYIGINYALIKGNSVLSVSDDIRSALDCWSFAEAVSLAAGSADRDAKIRGIYVGALSASRNERDRLVSVFQQLTEDADPDVRHALLVGIGYVGADARLREIAEELRDNDPDDEVRRDAALLLEGLGSPEQ